MPKYADKKRAGIAGYTYNVNDKQFQQGAWRNWPRGVDPIYQAQVETVSRFGDGGRRHVFTEKRVVAYQQTERF